MPVHPLPPIAAVVGFIDAINCGDVDRLGQLVTDDHCLVVFDEPPIEGRDANVEAWRGYVAAFPRYVISPQQLVERDGDVAVLGHTTGSHLGLPDDEEAQQLMIWTARVVDGRLASWQLVEDTPEHRSRLALV